MLTTIPTSGYRPPKVSSGMGFAIPVTIILVTCLVFLLVFARKLTGDREERVEVRRMMFIPPPPPPPPPDPPPPPPEESQQETPEMQPPMQQLSLSQLEMAINPGTGGALAGDFSLGGVGVEASETTQQLDFFQIADLDEEPRRVRQGQWRPPQNLQRIKATDHIVVKYFIMPDGTVQFAETVSYENEGYIPSIIRLVETFRYTKPTVGGRPVRAIKTFSVPIRWQ